MILSFQQLINEVVRGLQLDSNDIDDAVLDSIKLRINEAQDVIFFDQDWEWRKQTFYFTTRIPYETGTISVTQNSNVITGSGTTWTDIMRLGYLAIDGRIYKIRSIVSATSLRLEAPYDKETESGADYKILFPDYVLNHNLSSIVAIRLNNQELEPKTTQRLTLLSNSPAAPSEYALSNRTDRNYYETGTVSVTNNSTAITGSGTTWTSDMEGMTFRVTEFSKEFTIESVNSTTSITLKEKYDGDTGSGKSYIINPQGQQILTFRSAPDDYYFGEVEGLVKPIKLIHNNDISLIPNHAPLVRYSIWLAMTDLENKNPIRMQQAQADAIRSLKQLKDSYRVISNVRWRNESESQIKSSFDPLRRR